MRTQTFRPSPQYLIKLWLTIMVVALLILVSGILLAWLMGHDSDIGTRGAMIVAVVITVLDLVWWLPAMLLAVPYFRSLSYEVQDDEVIMRVGIVTKSVKHVPYRTVTNLAVKRGILDRLFGLGTLNIQTAGMSGTTGAEESLVGLANVQEVYALVATELRRFRGAMAPTAAGVEVETVAATADTLSALLAEVQAIRKTLETD